MATRRGYIAHERLSDLRLQEQEFDVLLRDLESLGDVAVVGGAVRDWLLGHEPRDIDLVVDSGAEQLAVVVQPFVRRSTRYGGYHLIVGRQKLDVWPLIETWAFRTRRKRAVARIQDLPATAFFNVDAIALRVADGQLFEHHFFEAIDRRILSTVFAENPFPELCAARALCLAKRYKMILGNTVVRFLFDLVSRGTTWDELENAQISHYGRAIVSVAELADMLPEEVAKALTPRRKTSRLKASAEK